MGDLALGIDVGTSGVRAALLDPDGTELAAAATPMTALGRDLRAPQIWQATLARTLAALDAPLRARIGAVAVDGTSGTVLAIDGAGAPIGTALMYNAAVEAPEIPAQIAAVAPRETAARGAASALARALVLQTRPGCQRILHQADWILGLLSGDFGLTDESNALKTGYDPVARAFPDWIGAAGLKMALLPRAAPVGAPVAATTGAFGLPVGATIVAGLTDGCASFLATGARQKGDGVTALGTTTTLKLLSDGPVFAPEQGIYSHRIGDLWLAGGASNAGGGTLAQHFTAEQIAALSARMTPGTPTGLDYLPLPRVGERFPVNDPDLAPRLTPRPADDAVFLQGLFEGIARIEAEGYRRLTALGAPDLRTIRTDGGGADTPARSVIRGRHLGVDAASARSTEAAVGTATLAQAWIARR